MPTELFLKPGQGRRLRFIPDSATAGLRHLAGSLWTSLGVTAPPAEPDPYPINIGTATNLPLAGGGPGFSQISLNFSGKPLAAAKLATVRFNIGAGLESFTVGLPKGTTATQAAVLIADALDWPEVLAIAHFQGNVRVDPEDGTTLSAFSVSVA